MSVGDLTLGLYLLRMYMQGEMTVSMIRNEELTFTLNVSFNTESEYFAGFVSGCWIWGRMNPCQAYLILLRFALVMDS